MKCHTGVDAGSGLVHTITVTAANEHDITQAAALIREDDEVVYGDAGYLGIHKLSLIHIFVQSGRGCGRNSGFIFRVQADSGFLRQDGKTVPLFQKDDAGKEKGEMVYLKT